MMSQQQPLRPPLPQLLKFTLGRLWYPVLLLPVALLCALVFAMHHDLNPGSKESAENGALVVLCAGVIASVLRWLQIRASFLLWLAGFSAALTLRELHPSGASTTPVYLLILGLLLLLWLRYRSFAGYLAPRLNLTLLAGVLATYFVSVGCDKNVWTFATHKVGVLQHVEEFIELAGHAQLLLLALLARHSANPLVPATAEQRDEGEQIET